MMDVNSTLMIFSLLCAIRAVRLYGMGAATVMPLRFSEFASWFRMKNGRWTV